MSEQNITYIFSRKAKEAGHGANFAEVPDGKGGRKEIEYTAICDPENYHFDDKVILWQGPRSDTKWLRAGAACTDLIFQKPGL